MIEILEQGSWVNCTNRLNDKEFISQSTFLSTRYECTATLVATSDYIITQAYYSIHRSNDRSKRIEESLPELIGGSASFDGAKVMKGLKDFDGVGKVQELFIECIRGLDQIETFLGEERGLTTREEIEKLWLQGKEDYCRAHYKERAIVGVWSAHIGAYDYTRVKNFYNKTKTYTIIKRNDSQVQVLGAYNDSFHEMRCEFTYNLADHIITDFDMIVIRAPYYRCFEFMHAEVNSFIGKPIEKFTKREVGKILGGGSGCFHLVEIVSDMALAVIERG